uniref:Uncharacterized protein n=2 Tax=Caenorhabditis japonica TaxID=281687 RepID=A0A8R1IEH3_CAEJA
MTSDQKVVCHVTSSHLGTYLKLEFARFYTYNFRYYGFVNERQNAVNSASALSRFASVKNPAPSSQPSSAAGSSGSAIGKKSMSTTNLVDDRQKSSGPSVASTGQAASAESLQHQTPSLENLLARAMPHAFGRIAENQEQEDEPMGGEESDSAASMRSASFNSQLSMGSSSVNSSQQQLQNEASAGNESVTPRDSAATPSSEKNQTLSVSAPDLAARRQVSAEVEVEVDAADDSEDKTVGEMEDDDEEEETMEDEEEEDDDDDDESSNENQEKLVELLSGERGIFDKLKEVITGESLSDASSSAKDANTNEAQKKGGSAAKKPKKWFKKMSSYTDVLKGLMANRYPVTLLDPTAAGVELEDLLDEDDYYDFSEDGPDDEDDMAAQLGLPVDSFASMVASRSPITWRQFSEMMSGSGRDRAAMVRAVASSRASSGGAWDDETVIKCSFEALIPAFDPRPGRSNVNQTLEVELPAVVEDTPSSDSSPKKKDVDGQIRFFLRGPNMSGVDNVTVEMDDDSASLFRYMQIINNHVNWATKNDRARRIWEPTYSICYCSSTEPQPNIEATRVPDEEQSTPAQSAANALPSHSDGRGRVCNERVQKIKRAVADVLL